MNKSELTTMSVTYHPYHDHDHEVIKRLLHLAFFQNSYHNFSLNYIKA